jgi:MFS family permease
MTVDVDRTASVMAVSGFALSLGASGLMLPLLALSSGYDVIAVGVLTAISAISQLMFRLWLPWLLTRFSDRFLVVAANVMMVGSFLVLLLSTTLVVFIVAQLLQGSARALFWTAAQTHAVRGKGGIVQSLTLVEAVATIGHLAGPPIAGIIAAHSLEAGLLFASGASTVGLGAGLAMAVYPPFPPQTRRPGQRRIWRRPGVDLACWAMYGAGGWRAMIMSLIPALLAAVGQPRELIGLLMMVSEAAGLVVAGWLMRFRLSDVRAAILLGVTLVMVAIIALPVVAANPATAAFALVVGGLGYGLLTSLGPALATQSVDRAERGEVLAVAGTFRAAATLVTPAVAAGAAALMTLPFGMVIAGLAIGAPSLIAGLRSPGTRAAPAADGGG